MWVTSFLSLVANQENTSRSLLSAFSPDTKNTLLRNLFYTIFANNTWDLLLFFNPFLSLETWKCKHVWLFWHFWWIYLSYQRFYSFWIWISLQWYHIHCTGWNPKENASSNFSTFYGPFNLKLVKIISEQFNCKDYQNHVQCI